MRVRIGSLLFVVCTAHAAAAQVYSYRDAEGVFHFSPKPVPESEPFDVGTMLAARPKRQPAPIVRPEREGSRDTRSGDERSYDAIIHDVAGTYDVDPALVKAIIRVESRFDPKAASPRGARGLMQLMPRTARRHGVSNVHDPHQNIRAGVRYLRSLLDRFDDDPRLALAAYNAGPSVVARYGGLPPYRETRRYVERVLRYRRQYGHGSAQRRD